MASAITQPELVFRNFNFTISIDGGPTANFSEASGFDATYDVAEYREGSDSYFTPQKFPGLVKYGNITLKRGVTTTDSNFFGWLNDNLNGTFKKAATAVITLTDPSNDQSVTWKLRQVWPVKYTGPDLNATASEIAIETLELAHEGIVKES